MVDCVCVVGVWGAPTFSVPMFVSMLAVMVTSVLESVGDYYAAARACEVAAPPSHAVNRGIAVEGLGSLLSGLFGVGHGITSYSAPTALICLTGVTTNKLLYNNQTSSGCQLTIVPLSSASES